MRSRIVVIALLILVVNGCAKPFQPVPPTFKMWQKTGVSEVDIKKALLECGYPTPFGVRGGKAERSVTENEYSFSQLCMEESGFKYRDRRYCDLVPRLEACQPGSSQFVPKRNINRRLNSAYCIDNNLPACK